MSRPATDDPPTERVPERVVAFLYLLLRDALPAQDVAEALERMRGVEAFDYSRPELARLAGRFAEELVTGRYG